MKKLFFLVMTFLSILGYGQNLSLSELISLRKMSLEDTETYLTNKGWNYKEGEEETNEKLGSLTFVYGTNGDYEYAQSFLNKYYSSYVVENRISIQTNKQSKYLEYLNAVKGFNAILIFTGTIDGNLIKVYQGATLTFIFKTGTSNNSLGDTKSMWVLNIWTNEDYDSMLPFNKKTESEI